MKNTVYSFGKIGKSTLVTKQSIGGYLLGWIIILPVMGIVYLMKYLFIGAIYALGGGLYLLYKFCFKAVPVEKQDAQKTTNGKKATATTTKTPVAATAKGKGATTSAPKAKAVPRRSKTRLIQ